MTTKSSPHDARARRWILAVYGLDEKSKTASLDDKLWELREHTHGLRKLQKELVGASGLCASSSLFGDLQQAKLDDSIKCGACGKKFAKSKSGVLSTCGHIGCLSCLKAHAENQECGVADCTCATRDTSVATAVSLGTEGATSKAQKTDGGVGVHGSKIIDVVSHIKSLPRDERILVFVQFSDLMQQVSSALNGWYQDAEAQGFRAPTDGSVGRVPERKLKSRRRSRSSPSQQTRALPAPI